MTEKIHKDSWDTELYDKNHQFVSIYGDSLIDLLKPEADEKILDLGCGTGDLAYTIMTHDSQVIGVDNSLKMIQQAQKKFPTMTFQKGDATALNFDAKFDGVFSNATLHWVKQPEAALKAIYQSLKTGGRFVAEFGGKGNCQTLTDGIIAELELAQEAYQPEQFPWYFPSIGEYACLMEKSGFRVTFAHQFNRPTPLQGPKGLQKWLEMFAGSLFTGITDTNKKIILTKIENRLRNTLYNGQWILDYKRIRVIGIKE